MPTIDCGHWNGRRNRLPHLAGSSVWQSRWGRRFRLPVEADFHRSSKSRKRLCTRRRGRLHGDLAREQARVAELVALLYPGNVEVRVFDALVGRILGQVIQKIAEGNVQASVASLN